MPLALLDIDSVVDNLRGIKADIESHVSQLAGPDHASQRHVLGVVIDQLGHRIVALEAAARHLGTTEIEVPRLTWDELRAVDRALGLLEFELVLESGTLSAKAWARLRAVLGATDDLLLTAIRGSMVETATADAPATKRRPGLVLALAPAKR